MPIIIQYIEKYISLLLLTNLIINLQANIPVRKAAIKPTITATISIPEDEKSLLIMSLAIFPKINGTTIKNENLAALARSTPNKTDVAIVAPERDMPGKIATA